MKKIYFAFFLLIYTLSSFSQITGIVTDAQGNTLPFVNIYIENTYTGTITNDIGYYQLDVTDTKEYTLIFQYLGFETVTKKVNPNKFPFELNVTLKEVATSLDQVIIDASEDPAYKIIRATIAKRKQNQQFLDSYTANFYSRGLWKVKDVPEKILGQEVGDMDGALDSTRTGIIYLSETISEIAFQRPNDFKETIIASKVSGNDNGFSFNSAQDANFSFYDNTIDLNAAMISPVGVNALNYYNYTLDGVYYEGSKLINKIIVSAKRPKDRTFNGTIYIAEDDWQLTGVELATNGEAIQVPIVENLLFKQNFTFDEAKQFWVKISQTIDFSFKFFGFQGDGRFIAVYSDYNFKPSFDKRSFTNEVLFFQEEANKKDSLYWKKIRPIPLTIEEEKDYVKKDSIQILRNSKPYLDSIDNKNNKFKVLDIVNGYTYANTYEQWRVSYDGPLRKIQFNTVQGWNSSAGLSYFKWYDDNRTSWLSIAGEVNYGEAEDRLRATGAITKNFNRTNRLRLSLTGGTKIQQYNASEPISPFINTISTLFFERNFAKWYDLQFLRVAYSQEIFNGLRLYASTGYEKRRHLFNTSDYVTLPQDDIVFSSNNPLSDTEVFDPLLGTHEIIKSYVNADIRFGQKYLTYPDGKYNIGNNSYPRLNIALENGVGINNNNLSYTQTSATLSQNLTLGNKGETRYNIIGSTFFNADDIAFVDYQHFNGNQTRVGTSGSYTNVFNLMPYYEFSTNNTHVQGHIEHDFKGWILGKIPGINRLNFNLVAGAHVLAIDGNNPYQEVSIGLDNVGFGKYRFLRLDYVQNFYQGSSEGAIIFGLKFLDIIN